MADAVSESTVVQASPDDVWSVIADFEHYPEWNDEIDEVEVLETDAAGRGTKVRFRIDAGVITAQVVLEYAYEDNAMSWWLVEGDKVRKNDGSYTLHPRDDGSTEVVYELEVEPAIKLPGMLRRQAAKRIVTRALKSMRERVEAG